MLTRAVDEVADHAVRLVKLEAELAAQEIKRKVAALGVGIGMLVTAAVIGVFGLGFALATVAAALSTFLATWLALLIVTGGLFLLALLLVTIGISSVKKGSPPVPELALMEARLTKEALKNGSR